VPTLVRSETRPPHLTLYVAIPLRNGASALTGIFFSREYDRAAPLNLILYLRGWTQHGEPIDRFWSDATQPHALLREKINSGGRNLVLVAPTLGARSEAGWLMAAGGPDTYLDHVVNAIRAHAAVTAQSEETVQTDDGFAGQHFVDNLILGAHSGGGTRMTSFAKHLGRYADKPREVWGFDCTYETADVLDLVNLARARADVFLHYHYIGGTATDKVANLLRQHAAEAQLRNVCVQPTAPGVVHEWVPSFYLESRIRSATQVP